METVTFAIYVAKYSFLYFFFFFTQTPEKKEDLESRVKTLKKKVIYIRNRIHHASRLMRKFPLGQDRYARQYWVLPSLGGILIEGVETSLDLNLQLEVPPHEEEEMNSLPLNERIAGISFKSELSQSVCLPTKVEGVSMMMKESVLGIESGGSARGVEEQGADAKMDTEMSVDVVGSGEGVTDGNRLPAAADMGVEPPPMGQLDKNEVESCRGAVEKELEGNGCGLVGNEKESALDGQVNLQEISQQKDLPMEIDGGDSLRSKGDLVHVSSSPHSGHTHPADAASLGGEGVAVEEGRGSAVVVIDPANMGEPSLHHESGAATASDNVVREDTSIPTSQAASTISSGSISTLAIDASAAAPSQALQTNALGSIGMAAAGNPSETAGKDSSEVVVPAPVVSSINQPQQEQVVMGAPPTTAAPTQQYVYVTPDGQIVGMVPNQTMATPGLAGVNTGAAVATVQQQQQQQPEAQNMAYALIGNALVPVLTGGGASAAARGGQSQVVAVNSTANQQQYMMAQTDPQGGVQYFALPGGGIAAATVGGSGMGVWPSQQPQPQPQPQYAVVMDANGQQQLVQVMPQGEGGQQVVMVPPQNQSQTAGGQILITQGGGQVVIGQDQTGATQHQQQVVYAAAASQQQSQQLQQQQPQFVVAGNLQAGVSTVQQQQQVLAGRGDGVVAIGQHREVADPASVIVGTTAGGPQHAVQQPDQQSSLSQLQQGVSAAAPPPPAQDALSGYEVIRGGQVVFIPEKNQYGVLSTDGTKLVVSESKEAAIALLQAANSMGIGGVAAAAGIVGGAAAAPSSDSPIISHSSSPAPSVPPTSSRATPTSARATPTPFIKKEPISPDHNSSVPGQFLASSTSVNSTPPHAVASSGKATPTTVGQVTPNAETTDDSSREQGEQKVMNFHYFILFSYFVTITS